MKNDPQAQGRKETARLIAYSDQIGYRSYVDEHGCERVEPVNAKLQAIFEAGLRSLRMR